MAPTPIELPLPQAMGSCAAQRFASLRGILWRINLGILPASPPASIEDLRRVAADTRRRYANLRRRLLIDPHLPKDGSMSPGPINDNPLSQNPDSLWGRFFRNAELEKMVDQDLSRLYPEHGSYFQTPACQAMLRRILLLWCLSHPEYGYRQGMHELLAPLLYVLHVDLQHLSQVQGQYEDLFNDEFDEMSLLKIEDRDANDHNELQERIPKINSLDELDPDTRDVFLLSDAYGAEGELGVILSERFLEHDAYSMFDSLMSGSRGVVAMADFFSPSVATGSSTGVLPVIEASSALYHLLSIVDSALHTHLVELGVEPQYFALRWLRVLFGREFSLDILLLIWDEIFSSPNSSCIEDNSEYSFRVLCSPRGAFIAAMAVSMLLHIRSSLFATENATSCLQRLLNFPANINVKKLILKAKSLQALALDANVSSSLPQVIPNKNKPALSRVHSLSSSSTPPKTPDFPVPDSYWEEKWRVLHEEEALKKGNRSEKIEAGTIKGPLVEKFGVSRTESDPSPAKILGGKKDARTSVRRSLLDDFSQEVDPGANLSMTECNGVSSLSSTKVTLPVEVNVEKINHDEPVDPNITGRASDFTAEGTWLIADNSSVFSSATSHHNMADEEENNSEKSSITSNSSISDNDEVNQAAEEVNQAKEPCSKKSENPLLQESEASSTSKVGSDMGGDFKHEASLKDRKPLSGKFQWFWKLGKGSGEGSREKGGNAEVQKSSIIQNICYEVDGSTAVSSANEDGGRSDGVDKKLMGTLKNLGQSMLENLQVIESAFRQDRGQSGNILGGNEPVAAMAALEELRKISNVLSEM